MQSRYSACFISHNSADWNVIFSTNFSSFHGNSGKVIVALFSLCNVMTWHDTIWLNCLLVPSRLLRGSELVTVQRAGWNSLGHKEGRTGETFRPFALSLHSLIFNAPRDESLVLEEIENGGFNENASCLPSTLRRSNLKSQQSPFILALDLTRTRAGNSHGCCNYIVSQKLPFGNIFRPNENKNPGFSNSSSLKSRDKLVWTIDLVV